MPTSPPRSGELVRQHRLDAGLTQAALAERAGISLRAVQDLERSVGRPQRETARRLAEALALTGERRAQFDRAAAPAPRPRAAARRSVARRTDGTEEPAGEGHAGGADLGGEQKRVTILVAEVVGLTESVEGFEPDLADQLQTRIVPLLVEVVRRWEGTVSRVGGDGLMALFGAPLAREDDAVRACLAAMALHEAFGGFAGQLSGERGPRLALRVGLASSDVVLRSSANDPNRAYTPLGPAVRVATRLGQAAADGTTLLTSETLRAAEGYIRARPVGPVAGGGASTAIEAFELTGGRPARTRFQRVVRARELTRFVGRDAELAALSLALDRGRRGVARSSPWSASRASASRVSSGRRRARPGPTGWLVLECGAVSHGMGASYGPAIDLVKAYCRIEARDDGRTVREKLTGQILALDRALEADLPALRALLDVAVEDAAWEALDPPRRRDRTLARPQAPVAAGEPVGAASAGLSRISTGSTRRPRRSWTAWSRACRPRACCCSSRTAPSTNTRGAARRTTRSFALMALPTQGADELLGAILGQDVALRPLKQQLIVTTEGNPLFLEESVRGLAELGALVGERGAYRQARPIDTIRVPETVQTVLMARIDRLDPDAKRLLQTAAVIGKDVPFALLRAIVEGPDQELHAALARLLTTELMYEAQPLPGAGVHVQARADPRGRVPQPAPGAPSSAPRQDRRGDRSARRATAVRWPVGSRGRSTGWAIMRCGASSGRRPSPTCGGPASETARARRIARRRRISSRRSKR